MYRFYFYYIKKFKLEEFTENIWYNSTLIRVLWEFFSEPVFEMNVESYVLDYRPSLLGIIDWSEKSNFVIRNYVEERLSGNLVNFIKKLI